MLQNRGKALLGLTQTLLNINYLLKETNKQEAELLTGINVVLPKFNSINSVSLVFHVTDEFKQMSLKKV